MPKIELRRFATLELQKEEQEPAEISAIKKLKQTGWDEPQWRHEGEAEEGRPQCGEGNEEEQTGGRLAERQATARNEAETKLAARARQ